MNHSPAPWKMEKYSDANTRDGERIRCSNGLIIVNEVWGASISECDANSNLIASAPDLLAALLDLQKEIRNVVKFDVKKHYSLMVADAAANAAIHKAGVQS